MMCNSTASNYFYQTTNVPQISHLAQKNGYNREKIRQNLSTSHFFCRNPPKSQPGLLFS